LIDLSIDGCDEETVSDHVRLLDRLEYVKADAVWTFRGEVWKSVQVTWKGADFLTRAIDDVVWDRAKQTVEKRVVGTPEFKLEVLKGLLDSPTGELPHGGG
jgi:Hypothetical protein (DUF2513)